MSFFVCRATAVPGDDADESLAQFSSISRGAYRAYGAYRASRAYRAFRGYHLWPFGHGINVVGVQPKPVPRNTSEKPEPPAFLLAFQNEKPDDESLSRFLSANATTLNAAISTKWVPVFNFSVPCDWIGKSVMEVAREGKIIVWGIRRSDTRGTRAIWFPGPGLKDEHGEETYVEKFSKTDEVVLPFWGARAFVKKYVSRASERVLPLLQQTI